MKKRTPTPLEALGAEDDDTSESAESEAMVDSQGDDALPDVDFEFFPFRAADWWSVNVAMQKLLDGKAWKSGEMADLLCKQTTVGSTLKIDGVKSEAIGFVSVLNLHQHQNEVCVQQLCNHVLSKCDGEQRTRLSAILVDPQQQLGLLLNERMMNVPPLVAPDFHRSLFEEALKANQEAEALGSSPPPHAYTFFLMITSCYRSSEGEQSAQKANKRTRKPEGQETGYYKDEDVVYRKHAVLQLHYPLPVLGQASRWTLGGTAIHERLILLIPATAIPAIVAEMQSWHDDGDDSGAT